MSTSCLIITSCVNPFSSFVAIKDVSERELLHIRALKRWLTESSFVSVIICDNSNYVYSEDLSQLALDNGKKLEILSFSGNKDKGLQFGKGFGEGELMKYIMINSDLIKKYDSFFKVTGKLFVENISLMNDVNNSDFVFSIPIKYFYMKQNVDLVYTNFYYAKIKSFELYLMNAYLDVRDNQGVYLEHVYANVLRKCKKQDKYLKVLPMIPLPILSGKSGSTGEDYKTQRTTKDKIRDLLLSTFLIKKL